MSHPMQKQGVLVDVFESHLVQFLRFARLLVRLRHQIHFIWI